MTVVSVLAFIACGQEQKAPDVAEATPDQVTRVEPPCWWAGMKTDLQLLVQGPSISDYDVRIFGDAEVTGVHKAESPNYLFVDVKVGGPGACSIVFVKDGEYAFKVPYQIGERREGSAERKGFSSADMIYLIMPDRFANGDPSNDNTPDTADKVDREKLAGRHGGDIKGIMYHLDYIADLGATAIWNTPLLEDNEPRESYHGYACSNYYRIDPRFGDNEMYCELVRQSHARGIKMIMDIVTNHCGSAHWWMKDLPFQDWVHQWPEYTHSNCNFAMQNDPNSATIDQINMQSGWFDTSMPDMNLDNPYLLQYFKQWAVWWIEYAGLDGLRVDTYPYNEPGPMSQWCKAVTDEYPNMNIVGECWDYRIPQVAYWQKDNPNWDGFNSNLPSIMDFPLETAMKTALCEDQVWWDEGMTRVYTVLGQDFVYKDLSHMMTFFANHDHARTGDVLRADPARMKLAIAMLATIRGIPQLYYGDEMMFLERRDCISHDGAKRIDFPGGWEGDKVDLFTEEGRAAATGMYAHAAELHDYTRTLFQWRKGCKAVQDGKTLQFLSRHNEGARNITDNSYAFFRYTDDDAVFVYINNTFEERALDWNHYREFVAGPVQGRNVLTGENIILQDGVTVAPKSALIVEFAR